MSLILTSDLSSIKKISPILYDIEIQNLICGYMLGPCNVAYWSIVTVTLNCFYTYCTRSHLTIKAGVLLASSYGNHVQSISPILFEVHIPNLLCRYILGPRSVTYCLRVAVTSGFSSRKVKSGEYLGDSI